MQTLKSRSSIPLAAIFLALAWSPFPARSDSTGKKPQTHDEKLEAARTKLIGIERAIDDLDRKKPCQLDTECELLEGGARNCGGPSKFFLASTANPKAYSQISSKIREYTKAEEALNSLEGASECRPIPPPEQAICNNEGRCEIRKRQK